jgi:quercetin dioxygenase-like cupin family protein
MANEESKFYVYDLDQKAESPHFKHETPFQGSSTRKQLIYIDSDNFPGAFYSEYLWHFPGKDPMAEEQAGIGPHTHPFGQVISFVGTNEESLFDLGGEVEIWLEDQKFTLNKTFLVYIPAGMRHGPIRINKIERPIWQYVLGSGPKYECDENVKDTPKLGIDLSKLFIYNYQKPNLPDYRAKSEEKPGYHDHISFLDGNVVEGADFYVEASKFGTPKIPGGEGPKCHVHPFPELIVFFGTNFDDIYDLNGEVELWVDDKQQILTRGFVCYIPENIPHCPLKVNKITGSMVHFTAGPAREYI